jgi:hypothetical protein
MCVIVRVNLEQQGLTRIAGGIGLLVQRLVHQDTHVFPPARLRTVIFERQLLKFCHLYSAHLQPDQDTIAYLFFAGTQAKFRYPP